MIGMQVTTRTGATLTAIKLHHKKRSQSYFVWECSTCSSDTELWPEGAIYGSPSEVRRNCPCGCGPRRPYRPEQMYVKVKRAAEALGHSFYGWDGEYVGSNKTQCLLDCKKHGPWSTSVHVVTVMGSGCPGCARDAHAKKLTRPEKHYVDRVTPHLEKKSLTLLGAKDKYEGAKTRILVSCLKHGVFESTYNACVRGRMSCSTCVKHGYSLARPATLYAMESECGAYLKIGVTNNVKVRLRNLKRYSPFEIVLCWTWSAMGDAVKAQEKVFHRGFETAGFRGFQGATEWLKADPAILLRFSLLPGAEPTLR